MFPSFLDGDEKARSEKFRLVYPLRKGAGLEGFLPHRESMLLLDSVVCADPEKRTLTGETVVRPDCIFFDKKLSGIPSWAAFEYMAQCIAVLSGIAGKTAGQPAPLGFVLSVSAMEVFVPVLENAKTVRTTVKENGVVDTAYTFDGVSSVEGKEAVRAVLTVMEADDGMIKSFLAEPGR